MFVVVLDLHHLVARAERPAEAVDTDLAGWVQRSLELDIERAGTEAATVHRTEHLDVAYRIQPEAFGDAVLHDRQKLSNTLFRVGRIDEIEVATLDSGEVGHKALIDAMRVDDDPDPKITAWTAERAALTSPRFAASW